MDSLAPSSLSLVLAHLTTKDVFRSLIRCSASLRVACMETLGVFDCGLTGKSAAKGEAMLEALRALAPPLCLRTLKLHNIAGATNDALTAVLDRQRSLVTLSLVTLPIADIVIRLPRLVSLEISTVRTLPFGRTLERLRVDSFWQLLVRAVASMLHS